MAHSQLCHFVAGPSNVISNNFCPFANLEYYSNTLEQHVAISPYTLLTKLNVSVTPFQILKHNFISLHCSLDITKNYDNSKKLATLDFYTK